MLTGFGNSKKSGEKTWSRGCGNSNGSNTAASHNNDNNLSALAEFSEVDSLATGRMNSIPQPFYPSLRYAPSPPPPKSS